MPCPIWFLPRPYHRIEGERQRRKCRQYNSLRKACRLQLKGENCRLFPVCFCFPCALPPCTCALCPDSEHEAVNSTLQTGAREMVQQLRAEDPGFIPTPIWQLNQIWGILTPPFDLSGHQAGRQCTDTHSGTTPLHIKIKQKMGLNEKRRPVLNSRSHCGSVF